tara:strand:- start:64 stop:321 length:258 start_codon:yes stop_codon:yes gene_type:complete
VIVKHQSWVIASKGTNPKSYTIQGQCYHCLATLSENVDAASVVRALIKQQKPLMITCEMCQKKVEIHEVQCFSVSLMPWLGVEIR